MPATTVPLADFPDLLGLHARNPARYPFLLESAAREGAQGRFDILFAFPGTTLRLDGAERLWLDDRLQGEGDFLAALDARWQRERAAAEGDRELPFTGGWFVYLGYELAQQLEPTVGVHGAPPAGPTAFATRCPAAVIRDHAARRAFLVCESEHAAALLPLLATDAQEQARSAGAVDDDLPKLQDVEEDPGEDYLAAVARVQEYIRAGDVFQVNLSRGWRLRLARPATPAAVYRRLREANPAPFAGLALLPDGGAIVSSSPERLVEVRGETVRTRPIAGTWPRSADAAQDRAGSAQLLLHPKERAEHVMLIDLERNDLGRICAAGSVRVSELMALESYRYVHHIVSEVAGRLRPAVTPGQVIRAVFPGGTITGCPKVRCMQIIRELEAGRRGAYTGSMGYINRDGSMDLNILIRTLTCKDREIGLRAGAGIVADSVPERELAETRAKARGLLMAFGHDTPA